MSSAWEQCFTPDGHPYYYNALTADSVWELPHAAPHAHPAPLRPNARGRVPAATTTTSAEAAVAAAGGGGSRGVDGLASSSGPVAEGSLWSLFTDEQGHPFYHSSDTGESRWAQADDWALHYDTAGRPFYHNRVTLDSVWAQAHDDRPAGRGTAHHKKDRTTPAAVAQLAAASTVAFLAHEGTGLAPSSHAQSKVEEMTRYQQQAKARRARRKARRHGGGNRQPSGSGSDCSSSATDTTDTNESSSGESDCRAMRATRAHKGVVSKGDIESPAVPSRAPKPNRRSKRDPLAAADGSPALALLIAAWLWRCAAAAGRGGKAAGVGAVAAGAKAVSVGAKAVAAAAPAVASVGRTIADVSTRTAAYVGNKVTDAVAAVGPLVDSFVSRMDVAVAAGVAVVEHAGDVSPKRTPLPPNTAPPNRQLWTGGVAAAAAAAATAPAFCAGGDEPVSAGAVTVDPLVGTGLQSSVPSPPQDYPHPSEVFIRVPSPDAAYPLQPPLSRTPFSSHFPTASTLTHAQPHATTLLPTHTPRPPTGPPPPPTSPPAPAPAPLSGSLAAEAVISAAAAQFCDQPTQLIGDEVDSVHSSSAECDHSTRPTVNSGSFAVTVSCLPVPVPVPVTEGREVTVTSSPSSESSAPACAALAASLDSVHEPLVQHVLQLPPISITQQGGGTGVPEPPSPADAVSPAVPPPSTPV